MCVIFAHQIQDIPKFDKIVWCFMKFGFALYYHSLAAFGLEPAAAHYKVLVSLAPSIRWISLLGIGPEATSGQCLSGLNAKWASRTHIADS